MKSQLEVGGLFFSLLDLQSLILFPGWLSQRATPLETFRGQKCSHENETFFLDSHQTGRFTAQPRSVWCSSVQCKHRVVFTFQHGSLTSLIIHLFDWCFAVFFWYFVVSDSTDPPHMQFLNTSDYSCSIFSKCVLNSSNPKSFYPSFSGLAVSLAAVLGW